MSQIIVTERPHKQDWHAVIEDDKHVWGVGKNGNEAIGDCYRTALTFNYVLVPAQLILDAIKVVESHITEGGGDEEELNKLATRLYEALGDPR